MKGMIILQGDEEGKKIFIEKMEKSHREFVLWWNVSQLSDYLIDDFMLFNKEDTYLIFDRLDCKTTKYLQDYYPFYIVKVFPYAYKIVSNYKDGKFLLGCKSDSFESDMDEVLRLISI